MEICVNDIAVETQEGTRLSEVLAGKGILNSAGLAVALNNRVIKKNNWQETILKNQDKVLIIRAAQGG